MDWKSHPPFCYLDDSALDQASAAMQEREFSAGDIVFLQGEEGDSLHLVTSGRFETYLSFESFGTEHVLAELGPGEIFGEVTVLTGEKRSAAARCSVKGSTRELGRTALLKILETEPKAAVHLAVQLARTLQKLSPLQAGVVFHNLDRSRDYTEATARIHRRISRICRALVLDEDEVEASIAMVDPGDANARDFLAGLVKPKKPVFLAITEEDFAWYTEAYLREKIDASTDQKDFPRLVYASGETITSTRENDASAELHAALCLALATGASDLHLEPFAEDAKIRLRVDGRLLECKHLPRSVSDQITSRLKVLCEVDIAGRRRPQDGSLRVLWDGAPVDLRAAFIPCVDGERVVLRFLGENSVLQRIEHIVHDPGLADALQNILLQPDGLILVTGPTGSGKTTTLYAALRHIWENDHNINIVTIEDPIDRKLPFASQIQIDPGAGFTFAQALRSVLRQDPDVILVGEIRDEESAEIAMQAAGTGHLVLSTLHTHSAVDSISRLKKLGVEPWTLASVLRAVLCQRLVTTIAPGQSDSRKIEGKTLAALIVNGVLPADWDAPLPYPKNADSESGRVALVEVLRISKEVQAALEDDAPTSDLAGLAGRENFVSLAEYAGTVLRAGLVSPKRIAECFPGHGSLQVQPPANKR
jgi:type II secretory ATPase GspE/PulE/Tfp pilus assembly ATPase PilB-like protein